LPIRVRRFIYWSLLQDIEISALLQLISIAVQISLRPLLS